MSVIQPLEARHTMHDDGEVLHISIPSRKNYLVMFFLGFWLIGWSFGEVTVISILIFGIISFFKAPGIDQSGAAALPAIGLFLLVWLTIWTVGGVSAIYTFLWQLAGREKIEVGYDSIKIKNAIFNIGAVKEFLATDIRDLRVSPLFKNHILGKASRARDDRPNANGLIAFDYGSQTFRFASGVDESEAKQILEKIFMRFPQFRFVK